MKKFFYLLPALGMLAACSPQTFVKKDAVVIGAHKSSAAVCNQPGDVKTVTVTRPMAGMMPKATAFKMSGNYADNVAVTIGPDGELTYFPAPSDISSASVPTSLGNGWYLNNQGIGNNSVFTKYTFEEYRNLPEVPSPQQLKEAIIPGARVTDMTQLPFTINDARDNIAGIKEYIKNL